MAATMTISTTTCYSALAWPPFTLPQLPWIMMMMKSPPTIMTTRPGSDVATGRIGANQPPRDGSVPTMNACGRVSSATRSTELWPSTCVSGGNFCCVC